MLEIIGSDYIKLVRLKGIPEWVVTVKTRSEELLDSHPDAGRTELARDDKRGGGGRSRL